MAIRLTVFFGQTNARSTGWSENFWNTAMTDLSQATQDGCNELILRLWSTKGNNALGLGHRITVYSETGFPTGISQTFSAQEVGTSNRTTNSLGPEADSDYPTISLLVEGRDVDGRSTRQWMHSIRDLQMNRGGVYNPDSAYKGIVGNLLTYMDDHSWGIKTLNRTASPKVRLFAIGQNTPHIFSTVGPHGLIPGQLIKLYRCYDPYKTGVNGTWHVGIPTTNPTTDFLCLGFLPLAEQTVLATGASYMKKQIFQFTAAKWKVLRATSRQVGRPFGSPSGRKKAQKRSAI